MKTDFIGFNKNQCPLILPIFIKKSQFSYKLQSMVRRLLFGGNQGMPPNKQCPSFSPAASVMPPSHDLTDEPTRRFGSVQQLLHCQGESALVLTKNEPGEGRKDSHNSNVNIILNERPHVLFV
jgi:hypothetical protein